MTIQLNAAARLVQADKWSADVTKDVKKHTPEGLFKKSTEEIAQGLKKLHPDLKGASSALSFYVNRAGENLDEADKKKMDDVRERLHKLYNK